MDRKILVTLVHGTFARDAEWTGPNSSFATELQNQVNYPIRMTRWQWSGDNDFSGRKAASEEFENYLLSVKESPDRDMPHYIIAHSHGGNVVLEALRTTESKIIDENLIFFGTPFFYFEGRDNKEMYGVLKSVAAIGSLILSLLTAIIIAAVLSRLGVAPLIFGLSSFLCAIAIIICLLKYSHEKFVIPTTIKAIRNKRKMPKNLSKLDSEKFLISYVSGDEAYLLLKMLTFAKLIIELSFLASAMIFVIWLSVNLGLEGMLRRALLIGIVGSAIAVSLAEIVSLISDRILIRHSKAFGNGSWIDAFSINIDVKRVPIDIEKPEIHPISFSQSLILRNRYIRHSIFYKNNDTISRIARWINVKSYGLNN